jgi:hypothetical protein
MVATGAGKSMRQGGISATLGTLSLVCEGSFLVTAPTRMGQFVSRTTETRRTDDVAISRAPDVNTRRVA